MSKQKKDLFLFQDDNKIPLSIKIKTLLKKSPSIRSFLLMISIVGVVAIVFYILFIFPIYFHLFIPQNFAFFWHNHETFLGGLIGVLGSIISGVIGGLLTLKGVRLTIFQQDRDRKLRDFPEKIRNLTVLIEDCNVLFKHHENRDYDLCKKKIIELLPNSLLIDAETYRIMKMLNKNISTGTTNDSYMLTKMNNNAVLTAARDLLWDHLKTLESEFFLLVK